MIETNYYTAAITYGCDDSNGNTSDAYDSAITTKVGGRGMITQSVKFSDLWQSSA